MLTIPVRIFHYDAEHLYEHRQKLVDFLLNNLNNDVEKTRDTDGYLVGSGMLDDLCDNRPGEIWVAWLDGEPVAWGMLTTRRLKDTDMQISIYVHPDFRRKKIGQRIANKAKAHAKSQGHELVSQGWDCKGKTFYNQNGIGRTTWWE